MSKCLVCNAEFEPFIDFGKMPLGNGFLAPSQFADEYFFDMKVGFCDMCKMVQLLEQPDREKMFHDDYAFFSSTSKAMGEHFRVWAEAMIGGMLAGQADPFVVELGSNDGIMLRHFAAKGIRHLGIEPSANVAKIAKTAGVRTISKFFDKALATEIVANHGQADLVMAANVMCHIPYQHSVINGFNVLLKPGGLVMFEDPYLGDIVEKCSYDQIYDEHVFYFSALSVSTLFGRHGFELVDAIPQETHGGSMRYVLGRQGEHEKSASVIALLNKEKNAGLDKSETYLQLKQRIEDSRQKLLQLLNEVKRQGKRVVGYAATSKSTTVINYCGLSSELVEFISDTTPIKQGKFSPGGHIPVSPYTEFMANYPDYALLFGWNHAKEIMAKEKGFIASGGKWIVYVPEVKVL